MAVTPSPRHTTNTSDADTDAFDQGVRDTPAPATAPSRVSRQLLLKFPDEKLPLALEDASRRSGRNNKSSTAIRAIVLGLKAMEERGELD